MWGQDTRVQAPTCVCPALGGGEQEQDGKKRWRWKWVMSFWKRYSVQGPLGGICNHRSHMSVCLEVTDLAVLGKKKIFELSKPSAKSSFISFKLWLPRLGMRVQTLFIITKDAPVQLLLSQRRNKRPSSTSADHRCGTSAPRNVTVTFLDSFFDH